MGTAPYGDQGESLMNLLIISEKGDEQSGHASARGAAFVSERRRSAFFGTLAAFALVATTVSAIVADGRAGSEVDLNDGGAWLLNRSQASLGHVNRAAQEISSVAGPFAGRYEVAQSASVVVVNNRGTGQAVLVDTSLAQPGAAVTIPATTDVYAAPQAVVLADQSVGGAWRFPREEFAALETIEGQSPHLETPTGALVAVGRDGIVAMTNAAAGRIEVLAVDGEVTSHEVDALAGASPRAMTMVGARVVALLDDGRLIVAGDDLIRVHQVPGELSVLQQPASEGSTVTGMTGDGQVITVDLASGETTVVSVDGADPIDPIVHRGCTWVITRVPAPRFHYCDRTVDLPPTATEVTLSLVNDWVWVNDVNQGGIWFVREDDLEVEEISDWAAAVDQTDTEHQDEGGSGAEDLVEVASADELNDQVDELDEDDRNEPPVARDDELTARMGRPVVVPVLGNDSDPDNDPLAVESLTGVDADGFTAEGVEVRINPDGTAVQVVPSPEFVGVVRFGYVVHDGRQGRDEATVAVDIGELRVEDNQSPIAEDDNATVRAGRSVYLNVLSNDVDPDGDTLLLVEVEAEGGDVTFSPDGEISFAPDVTSPDGTIELEYTVVDEFGAESVGTARIRVRQADSNQPPQARNDVARTAVGRSAALNVLDNDADPDGDPLSAQSLQTLDGVATDALLTPDGRFIFTPEAPGVYRFIYTVNDGPEIDQAQIRIDVDPGDLNRSPVAVVDEVKLAIGETRLIQVLANDGDADGDVLGLVDWVGVEGLDLEEVPGVGFNIRPLDGADEVSTFPYWVSDGVNEAVRGEVVVSALRRPPVDYRPVPVADSFDVRPGQTAELLVLRNDHDPEGRVLRVAEPIPDLDEGTLRLSDDGQRLLLKVDPGQQFGFQFSYDVEDPAGNRASAVVSVRVVRDQPNRTPVAGPDRASTPAGAPVSLAVLANDYDPDGDPIVVESIADRPANGTVELLGDGSVIYRPNEGFSGTDTFVYTLVDGYHLPAGQVVDDGTADEGTAEGADVDGFAGPGRSLGRVYVGVMADGPINRDPIAADDPEIASVAIGGPPATLRVLDNDSDPDFDPIRITGVSAAAAGEVSLIGAGQALEYEPPTDGVPRTVAVTYTIGDGRGGEASASVTVEVSDQLEPVPPVAVDDRLGPVRAGSVVDFDPRENDRDPDGRASDLVVIPESPGLAVAPGGGLRVTAPDATGELSYRVRDSDGLTSEPAVITVLVQANEPPAIEPITVETPFETAVEIDLHDAASDSDGDPLVLTLGANFSGGSVQVAAPPADDFLRVRFTPDPDFTGRASIDFTADDRNGHVVAGTAFIEVTAAENRAPVAEPIALDGEAGVAVPVRLSQGVSDPDGSAEHRYRVTAPTAAGISVQGPGDGDEVTVTSPVDAGGTTVSFDYTVVDGDLQATDTVTVALRPPSFPPPVTGADQVQILQGGVTPPIRVLDNDSDQSPTGLRGDGLTVTSVGATADGRTRLDGDTIVFTPNPDFFGTAQFTYTVQDGRRSTDGESTGRVTVDVIGRPDRPQPPSVDEVGNGYLVLSWRPPASAQGRGAVTGYELRYTSGTESGTMVFTSPTTSFRWSGLANGARHCFTVAAVNDAGQSEFSASPGNAECGTPDRRPDPISVAPTVEFGDKQLTVSWPAARSGGSPVVNYQVRMGGGRQALSPELGVALTHTWTGLTNGTDYTFQVRSQNSALDNDGWSDWSPISPPEHPLTMPASPAQPVAQRGDQQVEITWTRPGDGGDPITEYQVRSSLGSNWQSVTPQGVTNRYTWENIPNGTDVTFVVRAINRDPRSTTPGNISPPSPVVTTCTVPDPPAPPTVTPDDRAVVVSWNAPDEQGCDILNYQITASNGDTRSAQATDRTLVFDRLVNGTSYTFTVAARNEVVLQDGQPARPSPASESATPFGLPLAPPGLVASNLAPRQVRITWGAADPNGSPVTSYQLRVNNGSWTDVGNVTTVTRTEGANGTNYTYAVRAVNEAGPGDASTTTIKTWEVPGRPAVSAEPRGSDTIRATWSPPTTGGTALTSHQARLATSGGCSAGTDRTNPGSPETWSGLTAGRQYFVCVRYQNAVGWGPWGEGPARTAIPCPAFTIWGQSADPNLPGASIRSAPDSGASRIGSIGPGSAVTALGWRDTGSTPYPGNPSPYNQGIWYELQGGGWAIIAGVRGTSDTNDWQPSNAPPRNAACQR